ncbi:MAG: glucoamylase [Clostridiales bacterium]|nr:glucoamylase [Clostridiales bacterium]
MYKIIKQVGGEAFGGPGNRPTWSTASKTGVGTAFNFYSKVWFTIAHGIITEIYYPTLDTANTKSIRLIVVDKDGFVDEESEDMYHRVEFINPKALAYRLINTDKERRYRIDKRIITDAMRNSIIMKCRFEPLQGTLDDYSVYVFYEPHIDNSGYGDTGYITSYMGKPVLAAYDGCIHAALTTDVPWNAYSTGYIGVNDGLLDLKRNRRLNYQFDIAKDGNIGQIAELDMSRSNEFTVVLSLGRNEFEASATGYATINDDYRAMEQEYIEGWNNYCRRLDVLDGKATQLYYTSMMVIKSYEDKTHRGATIASMSIPWGEAASDENRGGYHLVWGRDLYHTAMAFITAGDSITANRALEYLAYVQQRDDGSFPQNSWLSGYPYWGGLQMDEVADAIILAWHLKRKDLYFKLVKPAADFICVRGPATQQERWEENAGYSPATIAAEIAGLVCAGQLAGDSGDIHGRDRYLEKADRWQGDVDRWCFTTTGFHGSGQYYIRISPNGDPNCCDKVHLSNGAGEYDQREVVDASFLELVRLGVKRADDYHITETLRVVDELTKMNTGRGVGWYRYNHDGYGETEDCQPYCGVGKGRLWPILTGERGHYELAAGNDPTEYIRYMEQFANNGYMLPEQVWDDTGEPTGSATPLAWSHAEYVCLLASATHRRIMDQPECVYQRYCADKMQLLLNS